MATTVPDGIWTPDYSVAYNLPVDLAAMADTIQAGLNSVRDGAAYRTGTDAERLALPPGELFDGLRFYATDTGIEWRYNGTQWVRIDSGEVNLTLNGGWSNTAGTATYRVKNGYASLNGRLATSTGATATAFTLPAGARPSSQRVEMVSVGGTAGVQAVIINTNGVVTFSDMTIPTGDYRLASISPWPVA